MLKQSLFLIGLWILVGPFQSRADDLFNVKFFEPRPGDTPKALIEKGYSCVKMHEEATALRNYQAVLKKGTPAECVQAYIGMGNVYGGSKDYAKALDSFGKAVALVKKTGNKQYDPYRGRAKVYLEMSKQEEALADMDVSMKYGSTDGRLQERGAILMKLRRYDKALEDYNALVQMSPNDSTAYFQRARVYELMGHHAQAMRDKAQGNQLSKDLY